jgi:hypothetical protein
MFAIYHNPAVIKRLSIPFASAIRAVAIGILRPTCCLVGILSHTVFRGHREPPVPWILRCSHTEHASRTRRCWSNRARCVLGVLISVHKFVSCGTRTRRGARARSSARKFPPACGRMDLSVPMAYTFRSIPWANHAEMIFRGLLRRLARHPILELSGLQRTRRRAQMMPERQDHKSRQCDKFLCCPPRQNQRPGGKHLWSFGLERGLSPVEWSGHS